MELREHLQKVGGELLTLEKQKLLGMPDERAVLSLGRRIAYLKCPFIAKDGEQDLPNYKLCIRILSKRLARLDGNYNGEKLR